MLTAHEVQLLDRLTLGSSPDSVSAIASGMRRARQRGSGLEFHEFRPYQPGDDPRSIDWTVEARLDQLVVRVPRAEGHARLHLVVDSSASMGLGAPSKLRCATRTAAALAYVALDRREPASACVFSDAIVQHVAPAAGRVQLFRILATLAAATAHGTSAIDASVMAFGATLRAPGVVVVISDFLAPQDSTDGLRYLQHRGLTPAVVQILAPADTHPDITEPTVLVDVERPDAAPLVVAPPQVASYRRHLQARVDTLRSFCARHACPYVLLTPETPFTGVLTALEEAGVFAALA